MLLNILSHATAYSRLIVVVGREPEEGWGHLACRQHRPFLHAATCAFNQRMLRAQEQHAPPDCGYYAWPALSKSTTTSPKQSSAAGQPPSRRLKPKLNQ